ncbi:MAG: ligand-binding sensor domain-containing protein [Candidatus Latescibacterota bacterium]
MRLLMTGAYSFLFLFAAWQARADSPWTVYSPADGLADTTVTSIAIDKGGILWFGAGNGGVSRFDGSAWKTYTARDGLGASGIRAITTDHDNVKWFAVGEPREDRFEGAGVTRFDGSSWKRYTTADGLADNNVRAMAEGSDGSMWFGTETGISRLTDSSWRTYRAADGLAHSYTLSLAVDRTGAVWAGSIGGISRFDGVSWKSWTLADGLPHQYVTAIADSGNGIVYIGTWGGGIARFNGTAWQSISIPGDPESSLVSAAVFDSRGVLWVGTHRGLFRFNGSSWRVWTEEEGLPRNAVAALAFERNFLWIGTSGGGAARFGDIITPVASAGRPGILPFIRGSHPNPFNPATTVTFSLPRGEMASLTIYNTAGQKIRALAEGLFPPGEHAIRWDGRDGHGVPAGSGVYFVRLTAGGHVSTGRMTLLR